MPLYTIGGHAPRKSETSWVAPSADVIGDVELSAEVGIWFGAVIRGDSGTIQVGARTNVQDGAMLHADPHAPLTIGEGVTIGHHAILHGCTVHDNVLIGMGATILNNAVIGANSIVGANALVTEDKEFPPFSLIVGSPARAIRTLDESAAAGNRLSAAHYAAKQAEYARDLKRVD